MDVNVLTSKLENQPDKIIQILEALGFENIKFNPLKNNLRFAREEQRNPTSCKVTIERKNSIDEICGNFTTNRIRFAKEFDRAAAAGAKTYILIENGSWEKINRGAYRSKMTPASLLGSLTTWLARYNCQIIFCEPDTTSWLIHAFLLHEMREALTHYELPQKPKRTRKGTEDDIIT